MSARNKVLELLTEDERLGLEPIYDENIRKELLKYGIKVTRKGKLDKRAVNSILKSDTRVNKKETLIDNQIKTSSNINTEIESEEEPIKNFEDRIKDSMSRNGTINITDSDEEFQNELLETYAKDLVNKLKLRKSSKIIDKSNKANVIKQKQITPPMSEEEIEEEIDIKPAVKKSISQKKIITKSKPKPKTIEADAIPPISDEEEEVQIEERKKNIRKKTLKEKPKQITPPISSDEEDEPEPEPIPKKEVKKKTVKKPQKTDKVSTAWVFESTF